MSSMRARTLVVSLALVTLAVAIHATALRGWWLYDDPQLLIEAIRQPLYGVLFDPAEYTHLAAHTFSPMQLLSFKFDLFLHGLDPTVFYAHQLLAIAAASMLFYLLLRLYVPDLYAALGSGVFLMTWAAVYAARTLMIRHYVEGLVFALAAMLAWRRGGRWTVLASLLYLLAMLSKEVYATLPIFFMCQSRYTKRPWREFIAPAIAAIVFLVWRWRMTGLMGGYTRVAGMREIENLPSALWSHIVGPAPGWAFAVWALCIILAIGLFIWRHRARALGFMAAALFAMILPILPLAANFEWRYSFAFVSFLIAVLTIASGTTQQRWPVAILAVLLMTSAITSIQQRRYYEKLTRTGIEQEGRYVWTQPRTAPALAARSSPEWYLQGLSWLRKREGRGEGPQAVYSRYAVTAGNVDPTRIVTIDEGRVVPFAYPDSENARKNFDANVPLTIEFAVRDHDAQWRLGPPGAHFVFLTVPGYTAIPIPPIGKQRVPAPREKQFFRIVREEDSGRWTVSPVLPVPAEGTATMWKRSLKMKVLLDRHPDDFLEPLAVRLDHAGGLVEKNALHAKQRHEHRDQIEARVVSASELPHPVLE